MVVNFIRKCCWLLGSQLSTDQYNAIVIAIAIVEKGKEVMVAMLLIADASILLLMIKDHQLLLLLT